MKNILEGKLFLNSNIALFDGSTSLDYPAVWQPAKRFVENDDSNNRNKPGFHATGPLRSSSSSNSTAEAWPPKTKPDQAPVTDLPTPAEPKVGEQEDEPIEVTGFPRHPIELCA